MKRITIKSIDDYSVPDESIKDAIQRLGEFEDAYDDLMNSQEKIPKDLEIMRTKGKEKTVSYKETLVQKLINNSIVMFFEIHGLK